MLRTALVNYFKTTTQFDVHLSLGIIVLMLVDPATNKTPKKSVSVFIGYLQ